MAEEDVALEGIKEFIQKILRPAPLKSFRESIPSGTIEVHVHTRPKVPPVIVTLRDMFPFMTLKDIKIALYNEGGREDAYHPDNVYLCMHGSKPGASFLSGKTAPVDFSWNFPGVTQEAPFKIDSPFTLASGGIPIDSRFVDSTGDRKLVSYINRERLTIEDAFFKKGIASGIPTLHAYLYVDLLRAIPGPKPPSELEWNGRLYAMFPHLSVASVGKPTLTALENAKRASTILKCRQKFLTIIEAVLKRDDIPLVELTMAGVKFLQIFWDTKKNIQGIDAQFYETIVDERRPFIRLIPTEGSAMSKIFLKDGKTPDIQDPNLIVQWSQERSPTPEQDYAFAKILLRKGVANVPPIYATLRLLNDGTADCIVEPPKGMKKLEPRNDLNNFDEQLVEGLAGLSYIKAIPELMRGKFVLGLRLQKGATIITPRIMRERLPIFSSMFQEIAALPGEKPMVMLRFKMVSNFAREDRIQTFLTQVIQRKILRGDDYVRDLVELVEMEFQIDYEEAKKQVAKKLQSQSDITLVVPETKEYMKQNNSGIDVAIFAQHPFYTFHLYEVNSLENLQRIMTALSVLMSASSEDLQINKAEVRTCLKAEEYRPPAEESESESGEESGEEVAAEAEPKAEAEAEPKAEAEPEPEAEAEGAAEEEEAPPDEFRDYLDFASSFAYDQEDADLAVADSDSKVEAIAAARLEGEGRPEPPLAGERQGEEAKPPIDLKREIATTIVGPREELEGVAAAAVPAAAAADEEVSSTSEKGIANFFLNKLREADQRLFDYTRTNPSLKRYVSQCQPTYGRQPAVLSEEKFQEMREEYAKDGVVFQVYPLQPGEKPAGGVPEQDFFTVLKYGSSPEKQNYYLCCRFFCTRDEILIREVDLRSTEMRRPLNAKKNSGECPFCRGKLITNKLHPAPGQTILERVIKPPTHDKRHLYIGFLGKTPHPEGYYLPCCFIENMPIQFKDKQFDKYREWGIVPKTAARAVTSAAETELAREGDETRFEDELEATRQANPRAVVSYSTTLFSVTKKYIIGAEKLPLDVGGPGTRGAPEAQIGLLPLVLNEFFDQDPTNLVSRAFNPQKIKPDGHGFLRVAVENRHRFQSDSFLAALAPFYNKNTAGEMKQHILANVEPRDFLALNYGNLAIEFYDPANSSVNTPSKAELKLWASQELGVDIHEEIEEAVLRAYVSYYSFQEWLLSDKTKKEYRQFALLCAQSNLLRREYKHGITFIVVDILKTGKVKIRCPPYGFNAELMNRNDVAFLFHHWSGIWEPIFHVDNSEERRSAQEADEVLEVYDLVFQFDIMNKSGQGWPPIVRKRLSEFMAQCSSPGRAIYTSQGKMSSNAMIPASYARTLMEKNSAIIFDGVVRDSYNHIGGLVFKERGDKNYYSIILPVVDDGALFPHNKLYLDWDDMDLNPAPIEQVLIFYKKYIQPRFGFYPRFIPQWIIKDSNTDAIIAIQLMNRLYIPVAPPSTEEAAAQLAGLPTRNVSEFEWSKNHEICLEEKEGAVPGEEQRLTINEFQEIFEHLRLTFSNWLASREDNGKFRKQLEEIIFTGRLPLFEKRKRMEIRLAPLIERWITTDFYDEDARKGMDVSLLRVDCTVKDRESCSGRCAWKEGGACMLHVPETTQLGDQEKKVNASKVLMRRLIEELLRYGERRRQLLEKDVSRFAVIDKPVKIESKVEGDPSAQVIFPERSSAWFELLRLKWADTPNEEPRFLEEMGRFKREVSLAAETPGTALSERLVAVLNGSGGADPKTGALRLLRANLESLVIPMRVLPADIGLAAETRSLNDQMLSRIVRKMGGNILQIDLREDPPQFMGRRPARLLNEKMPVPVIVIDEKGAGVLVLNPEEPQFLQLDDMPRGLLNILEATLKAKPGVIGLELPIAAAAPAGKTKEQIQAGLEKIRQKAKEAAAAREAEAGQQREAEEAAAAAARQAEAAAAARQAEAAAAARQAEAAATPTPTSIPPPPAAELVPESYRGQADALKFFAEGLPAQAIPLSQPDQFVPGIGSTTVNPVPGAAPIPIAPLQTIPSPPQQEPLASEQ